MKPALGERDGARRGGIRRAAAPPRSSRRPSTCDYRSAMRCISVRKVSIAVSKRRCTSRRSASSRDVDRRMSTARLMPTAKAGSDHGADDGEGVRRHGPGSLVAARMFGRRGRGCNRPPVRRRSVRVHVDDARLERVHDSLDARFARGHVGLARSPVRALPCPSVRMNPRGSAARRCHGAGRDGNPGRSGFSSSPCRVGEEDEAKETGSRCPTLT